MRGKRNYEEYRKLDAAFQKKAIQDKEQNIIDKCKQIEDNNKIGKTRHPFKEIKEMTGSRSSICGDVNLSTGKVISEEKSIKKKMATIYRTSIQKRFQYK